MNSYERGTIFLWNSKEEMMKETVINSMMDHFHKSRIKISDFKIGGGGSGVERAKFSHDGRLHAKKLTTASWIQHRSTNHSIMTFNGV
jgi:hypothetical protein